MGNPGTLVGAKIGGYDLGRLVGEGGMGRVFEARETLSGRQVAVKVMRPEFAGSEAGRKLFRNEMGILAKLEHANIVRCLACTEDDGQWVMAMEFLEGKTLRQLIDERGRLSWSEAVAILMQVTAALEAAHALEPAVVHRDLKPENVMVLPDGTCKVMDFGIAKAVQAARSSTTYSVGTLQYMSPEQIDAQPIGPQSDLYSLGLIAYELLTGAPPFSSESPREILNQQCTVPPPAFSQEVLVGLPHGLVHLIFALLHKKPEDRPASARVVRRELAPFMTGAAAPDVAPTRRESSSVPKDALDTIAIVERVSSRASIPNRTAAIALAIIAISVAAATYIVRVITYDPPAHGEVAHATR